jgi:hypothetical protein
MRGCGAGKKQEAEDTWSSVRVSCVYQSARLTRGAGQSEQGDESRFKVEIAKRVGHQDAANDGTADISRCQLSDLSGGRTLLARSSAL